MREISALPPSGIITLLTDFGNADGYVAAMKGVILSRYPRAQLVDVSHEIPAQAVVAAELLFSTHYTYFPRGTVHVAIVDPGVGTQRAALACIFAGHYFVAPDNGLLDFCTAGEGECLAVRLNRPEYWRPQVSRTFHGRDVFAPVAAQLALGTPLLSLGERFDLVARGLARSCQIEPGRLMGEIIYIDRFGNLISNISTAAFLSFCGPHPFLIRAGRLVFDRLQPSYGYVPAGAPVALFNSFERLEIGVNQGHAAAQFDFKTGTSIIVERGESIFNHAESRT